MGALQSKSSYCVASEKPLTLLFRYCVAKGDIGLKIPDNTTDEEASTLGVGINTVGQGLYQSLGLPLPGSGKAGIPLLVYGGSTATGSLAIQYVTFILSLRVRNTELTLS